MMFLILKILYKRNIKITLIKRINIYYHPNRILRRSLMIIFYLIGNSTGFTIRIKVSKKSIFNAEQIFSSLCFHIILRRCSASPQIL